MDFRTIQLERLQFDSPNKSKTTWRASARYGSEKRVVFQTPTFRANVLQHKFLPDALTLQKSSTIDDIKEFTDFLERLLMLYDASLHLSTPLPQDHGKTPLDYLTVTGDTVIYGDTDALQPGDCCRVACMVALTGGWCKQGDDGTILARGLTFDVDEVKVYDLVRQESAPKTYIQGQPIASNEVVTLEGRRIDQVPIRQN
jgi:hypothetical protein